MRLSVVKGEQRNHKEKERKINLIINGTERGEPDHSEVRMQVVRNSPDSYVLFFFFSVLSLSRPFFRFGKHNLGFASI